MVLNFAITDLLLQFIIFLIHKISHTSSLILKFFEIGLEIMAEISFKNISWVEQNKIAGSENSFGTIVVNGSLVTWVYPNG